MSYIDNISQSYYEVLGVTPKSETAEIKAAYREKLLSNHPDKIGSTASEHAITLIKEAYQTLNDGSKREDYDESLQKSIQRQGFNISGDGLDTYSLNDFEVDEDLLVWLKNCPRCQAPASISLSEDDLENNGTDDGMGGYDIIVQCLSCSLWIKVKYYEEE